MRLNSILLQTFLVLVISLLLAVGIVLFSARGGVRPHSHPKSDVAATGYEMRSDLYFDKVRGAWQAILIANYTGLEHEGIYLEEPSDQEEIELILLDQWPTDDDTAVEWVNLHILETHGLKPTYLQIRDEWIDHLNHDIWVSTRRARDLMSEGWIPPATGSAALNPDGVWSIDAQLQTELFGLLAPGLPAVAARQARYFARVTNSGLAVEASAFYAAMYAEAFVTSDLFTLLRRARDQMSGDSEILRIVDTVTSCHREYPKDWRNCRRVIRDRYATDPMWWAAKVNFASTIMALLYGQGDLLQTMTIASLAGWDADNNVTTSAGLLAVISGYKNLPVSFRSASEIYFNEDVTGDLPQKQTVFEIAKRTQALAEKTIVAAGGDVLSDRYRLVRTPTNE